MMDFVQLQEDTTFALNCCPALRNVNAYNYRKLRLQKKLEKSAIYLTPRNGLSGAGILVEMPEFRVSKPNLPGPEGDLILPILIVEEPNMNLDPEVGTGLSAESIAQFVLEALHGFRVSGQFGFALYADADALRPVEEPDLQEMVCYRCYFKARLPRSQTNRCDLPAIAIDAGLVTLANGANTPGADIWYTLDNSFPANSAEINPLTQHYDAPFAVDPGQRIRWAAFYPGFNCSEIGFQTA